MIPAKSKIITRGKQVIETERRALSRAGKNLDDSFYKAIRMLLGCKGKVVLTGVGKSGIIAQKIASTFNSTGTPAACMHPSDALHGDLGMLQPEDVLIVFSKSGFSNELSQLLPVVKQLTNRIIAVTGDARSPLGRGAAVVIDCSVQREACPYDLAPTASTTAMLAIGDALAVVLFETKGFTRESFASTHPAGSLGKRLTIRLGDIMKTGTLIPAVTATTPFKKIILEMSGKRLGCTLITGPGRKLLGIFTDGDLRRLLEKSGTDLDSLVASDIMTPQPMTARAEDMAYEGLVMMESRKRTHLPITDASGRLVGVVHLHDLIEEGLKP